MFPPLLSAPQADPPQEASFSEVGSLAGQLPPQVLRAGSLPCCWEAGHL